MSQSGRRSKLLHTCLADGDEALAELDRDARRCVNVRRQDVQKIGTVNRDAICFSVARQIVHPPTGELGTYGTLCAPARVPSDSCQSELYGTPSCSQPRCPRAA